MNAPTSIVYEPGCPYRRSISIHRPNCNEFDLAVRVELAALRDHAAKGMHRAISESAYAVLLEVARTATATIYAERSFGDLLLVRSGLNLLMMGACALEKAERHAQ
ncbi:hypothetical protein ACFOKI_02920 [Sphingomonas qilianensis]|uniref:Uncharacterized protein n=1 Tax=Sphingomonas qilianensis TaxID=1736690 RepID=A0ABU9XVK9_9SPHN